MKLKEILFALLRCEVCGETLSEEVKKVCTPELAGSLYKFAKAHDLAHLVGDAIASSALLPKENALYQKFVQQRRTAVYRCEQLNYELERISEVFKEKAIYHIPLKGSVLREYYPESWMRTSCDIDLFVAEEDLDKATQVLSEDLGYRVDGKSLHDIQLFSESGLHLELHFILIEENRFPQMSEILMDIRSYTQEASEGEYRLQTTVEFFYFYHIAHMVKHFVCGGCGIRPFLDLWIMERKMPCDKEKLESLLRKGGIFTFYERAKTLSECWFSNAEADALALEMEDYIFHGGVYGSTENKIAVKRENTKSKIGYLFSCIFLPYEQLAQIYPSLKGKKILTPFYQVRRWFRILFKGVSKKTKGTLKAYDSVTEDKQERTKKLFDTLEI